MKKTFISSACGILTLGVLAAKLIYWIIMIASAAANYHSRSHASQLR